MPIHVERVAVADPVDAARRVARAVTEAAPRARAGLLAGVGFGEGPGWRPAPWTVAGIRDAVAVEREIRLDALEVGRGRVHDHDHAYAHDRERLGLRVGGERLRVPSEWVGARLVVVVPCVHRRQENARAPIGPVMAGFAALARAAGASDARGLARVGVRLARDVFAHVAVIVDASFWRGISNGGAERPLAVQRCVGFALGRNGEGIDPEEVDPWLARRLGLSATRAVVPPAAGDAAAHPWPVAPWAAPGALADRGIGPLWPGDGPAAPGTLARAWARWSASGSS